RSQRAVAGRERETVGSWRLLINQRPDCQLDGTDGVRVICRCKRLVNQPHIGQLIGEIRVGSVVISEHLRRGAGGGPSVRDCQRLKAARVAPSAGAVIMPQIDAERLERTYGPPP